MRRERHERTRGLLADGGACVQHRRGLGGRKPTLVLRLPSAITRALIDSAAPILAAALATKVAATLASALTSALTASLTSALTASLTRFKSGDERGDSASS